MMEIGVYRKIRKYTNILIIALLGMVSACGGGSGGGDDGSDKDGERTLSYSQGGTVEVKDQNSPIRGTKVLIKPGTLGADSETISISYEDALPGSFRAEAVLLDARQASKTLVLKRTTSVDLELPAEVTMPYDKSIVTDNDVPVVLYWDEATGKYSAVAVNSINRAAGTITFRTAHFSKFVVAILKAIADKLIVSQPSINTNFRPNADGFFVTNFGAYESPGGSCLGMANYSTWYFDNKKGTKGAGLQTLYKEGVPTAEEDDQNVRELISRAFIASSQYWAKEAQASQVAEGEVFTGVYLIQSMILTGSPQVLLMSDAVPIANFGHAVTVYRYDADNSRFEIYDNNFPRETVYLEWRPVSGFGDYSKYGGAAKEFGFDAWHSSFSFATFENLFNGVESGWDSSKFARITLTQPAASTSDPNILETSNTNNVIIAGQVPRLSGESNLNAPRYAHLYSNGINKVGVTPVDESGSFIFTIPTLAKPEGTNVMVLISESDKSWQRGFRAFKQVTIRVASVVPPPTGPGWSAPLSISAAGGGNPKVVIDAEGNALAVWQQVDSGTFSNDSVWASRYTPAGGWGAPVMLETNDADTFDSLDLAMEPGTGKAMLLWYQYTAPGGNLDLWARPFDPATGWGLATVIDNIETGVGLAEVGVDAAGNAVAVWPQLTARFSGRIGVYANRYTATGGWGTAERIDPPEEGGITVGTYPSLYVAPGGNAVALWTGGGSRAVRGIWTNQYTFGGSWGTGTALVVAEEIGAFSLSRPAIAGDVNGNAVLVYGQIDIEPGQAWNTIYARRYQGGWQSTSTPVAPRFETRTTNANPVIKMNAQGAAIVAWGNPGNTRFSASIGAAGSWGPATVVNPGPQDLTLLPELGIDSLGNAITAWQVKPSTPDLWVAHYSSASGWVPGALHEETNERAAGPSLAMNERGNAVLAWVQDFAGVGSRIVVRHYRSGR